MLEDTPSKSQKEPLLGLNPEEQQTRDTPLADTEVNKSDASSNEKEIEYKTTWTRWPLIMFFAFCIMNNTMIVIGFAPVSVVISKVFGMESAFPVNLCAMLFSICSIPMTFVAIFCYRHYPASTVLKIASATQLLGAWLRYSVVWHNQFWAVQVGTALVASTVPVFVNATSMIANNWFADNERALATAIGGIAMPLGTLLSFTLTGLLFQGVETESDEHIMSTFHKLLLGQNLLVTVFALLFIFVVKEKPDDPPSAVALFPVSPDNIFRSFAKLRHNTSYMCLGASFALLFGLYTTFGNLLSVIVGPFGYTASEIAGLGVIVLIAGVFTALINGILLDKYSKYLLTVRILTFTIAVAVLLTTFVFPMKDKRGYLIAVLCLIGGVSVSMIPTAFAFGVELSYPTLPATANGLFLLAGQFMAFLLTMLGSFVTKVPSEIKEGEEPVDTKTLAIRFMLILASVAGVAFGFTWFIKEDLRRKRFSLQRGEESSSTVQDEKASDTK